MSQRNIELKARAKTVEEAHKAARRLAGQDPSSHEQEDIFFIVPDGRLKLRYLSPSRGQLIYYNRPDTAGPKTSSFKYAEVDQPAALRDVLKLAYGETGVVRKKRSLYEVGGSRIHIDQVEGLGDFVEIEVPFENEDSSTAEQLALELLEQLGITTTDLVEGAYVDLLDKD